MSSYLLELKREKAILQLKIAEEELRINARKRSRSRSRSPRRKRNNNRNLFVKNLHLEPMLEGLTGNDLHEALKIIFGYYSQVESVYTSNIWALITFSSEEARDYCLNNYVGPLSCSKQK